LFRFLSSRSSAASLAVTPGLTPSSMSASLSQRCKQDSEIPKSFAICDSGAWPLRATATTSRRNSLAFYTAVGYEIVGEVPETGIGHLTMLKLPGDEFVTVELVHNPDGTAPGGETRLSHFVIRTASMDATLTELAARGVDTEEPTSPDGSADFLTTFITDPDGNRIELVQWPAGHADGMSAADWAS